MRYCSDANIIRKKKHHFQNYLPALPQRRSYSDPLYLFFFKENRRVAIIFCWNRTGKPQLPWALWFTSWIYFSKNHRKQVWQNDIRHTREWILNSAIYALALNISPCFHGPQIEKYNNHHVGNSIYKLYTIIWTIINRCIINTKYMLAT